MTKSIPKYITLQEAKTWLEAQEKYTKAMVQRLIDDALDARDDVVEARLREVIDEIMIKR